MDDSQKKIKWYMLAFMSFSTVWGFGNVVNGFMYFNGIQVIFSWILMFALYFVPYALMVGEMGSAFKDLGGGVTSWVQETTNSKLAYYAGWTYWACHVTYIASKGSGGLKAISWMIFQNSETYDTFPTIWIQIGTLIVFLLFCWVASKGLNPLKKLTTLAGSSMFVMSILFIVMMFAAPVINPNGGFVNMDWSFQNLIPTFDFRYLTNLSILVFAVGGIEKISPYVNKMDGDASKTFPKAMIFAAVMVMVCAIFGTIALGMMFDPEVVFASDAARDSYIANGAYIAFQRVGEYYHVGNLFMIIYAACNAIGQFSTLVLSIDAPLRMLLEDPNVSQFVPKALLKQNKNGAYINGIKMVMVLSGSIIVIQMLGSGAAGVLKQLNDLNSVCMPLRYLWVFLPYIVLKKKGITAKYQFVKGRGLGMFFGFWCFFVTAVCCLFGMFKGDTLGIILNVCTPIVLTALGLILPKIRAAQDAKEAQLAK